ncbi:MAG TPA: GNAT family N-acetyltransferase [bacterium]|jgi:ribosomal protein S18 acetylase RimI-like enzyme|nr:GNAT family N-acetyltransferase [bacterium]
MKLEYASPDDRKFRDWLRKYREEIGGEAPSDAWLDAYTRHIFSEQGKHRHIWWGVDGGRRIGFAVAMVIQQPVDRGRQQGMIAEFFIYPEYRREGYGRKLADAIIEFFQERGITDVHASVIADNVRGIRFWEACSFQIARYVLAHRPGLREQQEKEEEEEAEL